jgi:hypothetical protein
MGEEAHGFSIAALFETGIAPAARDGSATL